MTEAWLVAVVVVALLALAVLAWPAPAAPRAEPFAASTTPAAWVINLRRNHERLAAFEKTYRASDLATVAELRRLDAVDGAEVNLDAFVHPDVLPRLREMMRTGERKGHQDLTPGAVGCYLSHMEAWRRIAASGAPWGLVFEDDVLVDKDAWARLGAALAALGDDAWDIVFLGTSERTTAPPDPGLPPGLVKLASSLGLFAYAISARAARRLVDALLPVRRQVDWEVSARGLRQYALSPAAARHNYMGTDIQSPLKKA